MKKKYVPRSHGENKMKNEGNVVEARQYYYKTHSKNLKFLLKNRFEWMNDYININDKGIEVGCGTGISKDFIHCNHFLITDYANHDWLDVKMVDALKTPFENNSLDFVVSSNMIHHVPFPGLFFKEMLRILKPNGKLIIQEINCSFLMQTILKLMRHEGYDFNAQVFNDTFICTDENDLWSANCAIPNLLFDNRNMFKKVYPQFEMVKYSFSECFIFLNSGGVIAKTKSIPLNLFFLKLLSFVDKLLIKISPNIFALQRQIVLIKK